MKKIIYTLVFFCFDGINYDDIINCIALAFISLIILMIAVKKVFN